MARIPIALEEWGTLRLQLLSRGAHAVIGRVEGDGGSANDQRFWVVSYAMPHECVMEARDYLYRVTNRAGEVLFEGAHLNMNHGPDLEYEFRGIMSEFDGAVLRQRVKIEDPLHKDLWNLFTHVRHSTPWWTLGGAGSYGEWVWNLKTNASGVEGYHRVLTRHQHSDIISTAIEETETCPMEAQSQSTTRTWGLIATRGATTDATTATGSSSTGPITPTV